MKTIKKSKAVKAWGLIHKESGMIAYKHLHWSKKGAVADKAEDRNYRIGRIEIREVSK